MSNLLTKHWYVLQVFSGFEFKILKTIKEHIKIYNMEYLFGDIIIPTEELIEIRKGCKYKSEHKFFPGYIFIQMIMNDSSWHLIKKINKVIGFVGGTSDHPLPISDKELNSILERIQQSANKPRQKNLFLPGELIRVKDGPFVDFNGIVEEVDYEKNKLKVSVTIFGRSTPVELDFNQIEKEK